jgi:hypothetical protein
MHDIIGDLASARHAIQLMLTRAETKARQNSLPKYSPNVLKEQ